MKINLKGVVAGAIGAVMAASSLLVPAMAADHTLADYPVPFVDDGQTNFLIVVGETANPADVIGAVNIAVRLGAERTETTTIATSGGTKTITEGVDLGASGDLIYLKDSFSKDTLTKTDLPNILADGTFTDDDGTNYDYTQTIVLGSTPKFEYEKYDTDKDPELIIDLQGTSSSNPLYTLKVTFSKTVPFNTTKCEGQTITLFGKEYTIAPETTGESLVLYGASDSVTLNKDEETTVNVGGTDYTIKVIGFDTSADKVILSVNGNTNDVKEGFSKKIGGIQIYAKSVTSWDQGNAGIAILQIGSQKITFEDGQPVQVGDDNDDIEGTQVEISTSPASLSTLEIKVFKPDSDNDYISLNKSFEDPVFKAFKISLAGISSPLTAETRDQIKLATSGDKKAYIEATDKDGNTKDIYVAYLNATNDTQLLDDNQKKIAVVENTSVKKDEYTFLAPGDAKYTHLVKVKKIYLHDTKGYVEFRDVFSGAVYKTTTGKFKSTNDKLTLTVDGKEYTVTLADNTTESEKVSVSYDNDNKLVVYPAIELKNGEQIALTEDVTLPNLPKGTQIVLPTKTINLTSNTTVSTVGSEGQVIYNITVNAVGPNNADVTIKIDKDQIAGGEGLDDAAILVIEEQDNNNEEHAIVLPVVDTDNDGKYIGYATSPVFTQTKVTPKDTENDKLYHYVDYYGTFIVRDTSDSHHTVYTIYYPDEQMYALVGLGSEVSVGGGTGTATYEKVIPIKDNIARLATSDFTTKVLGGEINNNLILVGGPCANNLVEALATNNKTLSCSDWLDGTHVGEARIQLIKDAFTTGQYALVVAGLNAENTQAACSVLQKYEDYNLEGTTVKVTGTTTPSVEPLE